MERKCQNLEFSQKLSTKSEDSLDKRPHKLFAIVRPARASGGDIASEAEMHCKTLSYQDISSRKNLSEEEEEEEDDEEIMVGHEREELHSVESGHNSTDSRHRLKKMHSTASTAANIKKKISKRKIEGSTTAVKYGEVDTRLKTELSKYKSELKAYNNTTKDLEEQYLKINYELSEMQQKHDRFVANRKNSRENDIYTDSSSSSTASEFALKRKYTQVFHRGSSFITMLPARTHSSAENMPISPYAKGHANIDLTRKKRKPPAPPSTSTEFATMRHTCTVPVLVLPQKRQTKRKISANKENEQPPCHETCSNASSAAYQQRGQNNGLKDIYNVLKNVLETNQSKTSNKIIDLKELQSTIASLQNEQAQFRNIIQQQQNCLHDYHSRCVKAQHIMQTQQVEIEKLNSNNQQLESEISSGIDQLRVKIDSKLRDVSHLPQMMRDEQSKYEKATKENITLSERLRLVQSEASQLKLKMEEVNRRKSMTINRLRAAERDLKIFKNYNTSLKHEKRKLNEELQKLKEQMDTVQNSSKRTLARQREQTEKQRRDLQKRVFELELKLSRSQNSTTSLIQERDNLIAELQTQLNTLVHNFEVSQKHIRVLRRHIYTMTGGNGGNGGNGHSNSRILREAM